MPITTAGAMTGTSPPKDRRPTRRAAWLASPGWRRELHWPVNPWRSTNATIMVPTPQSCRSTDDGDPQVADTNLSAARIIWEARGQEPGFGGQSYSFTLGTQEGNYWIESEVQWPDGRRAFA